VERNHFRTLYREFLFRIIDLELLAPQGDIRRLLGQFAALLLFVSFWVLMFPALSLGSNPPSEFNLLLTWGVEHFLISTTMLMVGLFAVLSWESMFPDRRDVMVLMPLPVRSRTILLSKVAAVASALAVSILCLNIFPGIAAPFSFPSAPTLPSPKYDAAMAPVKMADLKPVLDRDMNAALDPGSANLALGRNAGIVVGILQRGERRVFTYGRAKPDSIFQIGSITKTFTALLLAQMVEQGKVRFDEPVRELLPEGTAPKPKGDEITLLDLATHHSGLPALPDNINPENPANPYADYHAADLYAYLAKRGVGRPHDPPYSYSNLGVGLLGQALANRAGLTYGELLEQQITGPLALHDTDVSLSSYQKTRLIQGYSGSESHDPVRHWDMDSFAGAGATFSTAGDLLTYLDVQMHPEKSEFLSAALVESQKLRNDLGTANPAQRIALAWAHDADSKIYFHNGATAGFTSYACFSPEGDYAVVVLINTGPNLILNPGQIADHIRQRLTGEPAVSLAREALSGSGGFINALRSFAAYWFTLLAAGLFVFCFVLTVQGLAQLLPRQLFLRVSVFLQVGCFGLFLFVYLQQPLIAAPQILAADQRLQTWLPTYWFSSLFQTLNGPIAPPLAVLARRAWIGLAISIGGACCAYLICYFRTLRKVAEQPDILPSPRRSHWLPPFGGSFETAIGQFSARTLFRSRQHRMIVAFYLGTAIGLAVFMSKVPITQQAGSAFDAWSQVNKPLPMASVMIMCAAVLGVRLVFSMPLELGANWIFRVMPPAGVPSCLAAVRRTLYVLSALPVWAAFAPLFLWIWPWRIAVEHLLILALAGAIVCELSLYGFQKIPFTCSYLPGKLQVHMMGFALVALLVLIGNGAAFELGVLHKPARYFATVGVLGLGIVAARWWTAARANADGAALTFEDEPAPDILELRLQQRGVLPIAPNAK